MTLTEQKKRELIAHVKRESAGYTPTANAKFDTALFEARFGELIKEILTKEAK